MGATDHGALDASLSVCRDGVTVTVTHENTHKE